MTEASCSCDKCKAICLNPGWFSPSDALAAMEAGLSSKMMLDYYIDSPMVYILAPASEGCAGTRAPNTDELSLGVGIFARLLGLENKGRCVFLNEDELCNLHDTAYKPAQCRANFGCTKTEKDLSNDDMAAMWRAPEAQELCRRWMSEVGMPEEDLEECF